ncbi:hypothetical protein [Lysobacter gummosus]|uniref:hypothetical protein n=1 Tax=Lysobacter gummosus TaxID=262324 RepID=UPI00363B68AC
MPYQRFIGSPAASFPGRRGPPAAILTGGRRGRAGAHPGPPAGGGYTYPSGGVHCPAPSRTHARAGRLPEAGFRPVHRDGGTTHCLQGSPR